MSNFKDYIESLSPKVKIQVCRQIMEILEENMKEITAAESKTGDCKWQFNF